MQILNKIREFLFPTPLPIGRNDLGFECVDFMCDLETLGTKPGCKIMSIGVNAFNADTDSMETFYVKIKRDQPLAEDPKTIAWWDKQSEEARHQIFHDGGDRVDLADALLQLNAFIYGLSGPHGMVWGNGANFDNPILATAYSVCGIEPAWKFYNDRCYRTIKSLAPHIKFKRHGVHHNALDDAVSQTTHMLKVIEYLNKRRVPGWYLCSLVFVNLVLWFDELRNLF